jgi:hypothetical protein
MNQKVKNASNHSIFRKTVFYKQVLEFHRPSNFYVGHLGVKVTGPYCSPSTHPYQLTQREWLPPSLSSCQASCTYNLGK